MPLIKSEGVITQAKDLSQTLVAWAGKQLIKSFGLSLSYQTKSDHSHVTKLDNKIEDYFISKILKYFPNHSIHGEESGDLLKSSPYTWYLDPIDGTSNFLMGGAVFGTMIALTHDDKPILSVIYAPITDTLFLATSEGLLVNDKKVTITAKSLPEITLLCDSGKSPVIRQKMLTVISQSITKVRSVRIPGCVSSHVQSLSTGIPVVSMIFNAPSHDVLPVVTVFNSVGFDVVNRFGKPWTLKDHESICYPPNIYKEVKPLFPLTYA